MVNVKYPLRPGLEGLEAYGAPQLDVEVRINVNENPYPLPPQVVTEISAAVAAVAGGLNRYPDRDFAELRQALAAYLAAESQVSLDPEWIWAANGSNEVMLHLFQAFGGPGHPALSFSPTYSMYPEYARDTLTPWISAPRGENFAVSLADLEDLLATHHPALVVLASPNNPTGTALEQSDIAQILRLTTASGPQGSASLVVIDEAYIEFRRSGKPSALELLEDHPHLVVSRTMSKAFAMAGLRLGYLAAHPRLIEHLKVVRLPYHLSAVTQASALAALRHAPLLQAQVAQIRQTRDELVETLRGWGLQVADSDTNFVFFGTFADRHRIWQELLDRGVLIREVGPEGWLRASIGTETENQIFVSALKEVLGK